MYTLCSVAQRKRLVFRCCAAPDVPQILYRDTGHNEKERPWRLAHTRPIRSGLAGSIRPRALGWVGRIVPWALGWMGGIVGVVLGLGSALGLAQRTQPRACERARGEVVCEQAGPGTRRRAGGPTFWGLVHWRVQTVAVVAPVTPVAAQQIVLLTTGKSCS